MKGITVQLLSLSALGAWESEDIENVLVAPVMEVDSNQTIVQLGHRAVYHLAIPKTDEHVWEGQLVQIFGCTWSVIGIPTRGIDHLIPGPWNQKVTVELYRTGTPAGESLWTDSVFFPVETVVTDEEGYRRVTPGTPREVRVIFVSGVDAEHHSEADKVGMRRKAVVEIWQGAYLGEKQLTHDGTEYEIKKVTNTGRGSRLLELEEVWR